MSVTEYVKRLKKLYTGNEVHLASYIQMFITIAK